MEEKPVPGGIETPAQLRRYASDMACIYRSEKEKRRALEKAHRKLQQAHRETIHRLVIASEYRDEDTGDHIVRMAAYSALIAAEIGLPGQEVEQIRMAAPMHDVGKIGIPDGILLKPGKLTREEFETIKGHTLIGARILAGSRSDLLCLAKDIALNHHEKWNGEGYPAGLAGEDIPLAGRIVAVADVFDALTSKRPYKEPFSVEKAVGIMRDEGGAHFDPALLDVFLANLDAVRAIQVETASPDAFEEGEEEWSE